MKYFGSYRLLYVLTTINSNLDLFLLIRNVKKLEFILFVNTIKDDLEKGNYKIYCN